MINPMKRCLFPFVLLGLISGCAAKGSFPSLAPRPFELGKSVTTDTPPPALPLPPSDSALLTRLDALVRSAESTVRPFNTALAEAKRSVDGSGWSVGSESWVAAQMAISRLERTRDPARTALSAVDNEKRALLLGGPTADLAALNAAVERVEAINTAQGDAVNALIRAVSPRR